EGRAAISSSHEELAMATAREVQNLYDRIAKLREVVIDRQAPYLIQHPELADAIVRQIDEWLAAVVAADANAPSPPDGGLAKLVGLGSEAAEDLDETRLPQAV